MRACAVHQFLPVLDGGDAIGNYALAVRRLLRQRGHPSQIYVWRAGRGQRRETRKYLTHAANASADDVLLYHFSVCSPITRYFAEAPGRRVMIYHNITPAQFFVGISDEVHYITKKGREELKALRAAVALAIADSEFNRAELEALGYRDTVVVPVVVDTERLNAAPARHLVERYRDGVTNLLYVGRITPNKKQEDVIRVFSIYHKYINPRSRLLLVGSPRQVPQYQRVLERLVARLKLDDVVFTGGVAQAELNAYYSVAHCFISMSEHEGFCVPLLEAMWFKVPVVAFAAAAVPETMGASGVLVGKKDIHRIAEMVHLVVGDAAFREQIVESQCQRLRDLDPERSEKRFLEQIDRVLAA